MCFTLGIHSPKAWQCPKVSDEFVRQLLEKCGKAGLLVGLVEGSKKAGGVGFCMERKRGNQQYTYSLFLSGCDV